MTQSAFNFKQLDAESFIVRRLRDHGAEVFTGITDPQVRKDRIRAAILNNDLDCAIVGKNTAGKVETYSQLFERHYGEPLLAKQPKGKKHAELE